MQRSGGTQRLERLGPASDVLTRVAVPERDEEPHPIPAIVEADLRKRVSALEVLVLRWPAAKLGGHQRRAGGAAELLLPAKRGAWESLRMTKSAFVLPAVLLLGCATQTGTVRLSRCEPQPLNKEPGFVYGEGSGASLEDAKLNARFDAASSIQTQVRASLFESASSTPSGTFQSVHKNVDAFVSERLASCDWVKSCVEGETIRTVVRCNKQASIDSTAVYVAMDDGCNTTDPRTYNHFDPVTPIANDQFCAAMLHTIQNGLAFSGIPMVTDRDKPHAFTVKVSARRVIAHWDEGGFFSSKMRMHTVAFARGTLVQNGNVVDSYDVAADQVDGDVKPAELGSRLVKQLLSSTSLHGTQSVAIAR